MLSGEIALKIAIIISMILITANTWQINVYLIAGNTLIFAQIMQW